jgi:hypothetical protein
MGGRGPAPKPAGQRRRRNLPVGARTLPASAPAVEKPELGPRPDGIEWHDVSVAYWDAIWDSPMASQYDTADVFQMVLLLDLVHEYWRLGPRDARTKILLAAEIRLQCQNFGLTPLDRSRLKWEIERADDASSTGQRRRTASTGGTDPRASF